MATKIEIPQKLLHDVTDALREDDRDLAARLERYLPHNGKGHAVCDARRTAVDGALHKGVHICGLRENHKGDHHCNRVEDGARCEATWHKLVRSNVASASA